MSDFTFTFHFHALEKEVATCQEPPQEIPPMTKVMRKRPDRQRRIRPQGTPWICSSIYPQTKICLSYYFLPFTNSSDIATAAKSLQSWPTLCDPIDGSPPGLPSPGILQARTLEWVAISFSNAWKWKVKVKSLSHVRLFTTPWPAAYQAPLSMGFSRQEYWSELPLPSPK